MTNKTQFSKISTYMPALKPIAKAQVVSVEGIVMKYEKVADVAQPIEEINLGVEGCKASGPVNLYELGLTTFACIDCAFHPAFGAEGGCKGCNPEGMPPSNQ